MTNLKINKKNELETILRINQEKPPDMELIICKLPKNIAYRIKNKQITITTTKKLQKTPIPYIHQKTKHLFHPTHIIVIINTDYIPLFEIYALEQNIMITTYIVKKNGTYNKLIEIIGNIKI